MPGRWPEPGAFSTVSPTERIRIVTGAGATGAEAGAGVAAHLMLIFGSLFVMFLLAELFDSYIWAALVVTVLWAVVAAVLALIGKSSLKNVQGMPRTQETVQKVPAALKGNEN